MEILPWLVGLRKFTVRTPKFHKPGRRISSAHIKIKNIYIYLYILKDKTQLKTKISEEARKRLSTLLLHLHFQ